METPHGQHENPFSPESFLKWLPWAIVGLFVVCGMILTLTAGLPWETKEHAEDQRQLIAQQMSGLVKTQETTSGQLATLATSVTSLTQLMASFQAAREQEERDRLKKMSSGPADSARYRTEIDYRKGIGR